MQSPTCFLDVLVAFQVPSRCVWDGEDQTKDDGRNQELEYDDKTPVPFAEFLDILGTSIVDPEADERAHRVEQLPESHDLASDMGWSELADVYRPGSERDTLSHTNDASSYKENREVASGCPALDEGGDDDQNAASTHSNATAEEVSYGASEEPSAQDGTYGIGCVDAAWNLSACCRRSPAARKQCESKRICIPIASSLGSLNQATQLSLP